ncbi:MAG: co-chaperone GroES [Candidatus Brocadiae bacterium]|nr:co-chaperone GroES [Candidatus Brocadiia bacterium]
MAKTPKVRPLGDRILIERLEAEGTTAGGIVLPDAAKEKPKQGKVLAVGDGVLGDDGQRIPLQVKVGDTVLFGSYAGTEVTLGDEEYLIMRQDDVLGILA